MVLVNFRGGVYQKCFYALFGHFVCTHKKKKMRGDVFTKALNKSVQKIKPQSSLPSDELLLEMILLLNGGSKDTQRNVFLHC